MDAQIEHQDFAVLALYLVPRFVVCQARTIAVGWGGRDSPPTLKKWTWGAIRSQSGGVVPPFTLPQKERFGIDA
jgi:hypothetical protein